MKKLLLGVAISAALAAGSVHAFTGPAPAFTPANTTDVYLSGASASRQFIETYITAPTIGSGSIPAANRLCIGDVLIFRSPSNNYNAYACEVNSTTAAIGTIPANVFAALHATKPYVIFHKRSAGGSAQGVVPLATAAPAAIDFLNVSSSLGIPAGCTGPVVAGNIQTYTCPTPAVGANANIPDFGVSDVDPAQFVGANQPAVGFGSGPGAALTPALLANLTVKPAFGLVFSTPISLKFRNALQAAQFKTTTKCNPANVSYMADSVVDVATKPATLGNQPWAENVTCMPSLNKDQINSMLTGKITSGKQIYFAAPYAVVGIAANAQTNLYDFVAGFKASFPAVLDRELSLPADPSLHMCSRVDGSGTKATASIKHLNSPCSSVATDVVGDTGGLDPIGNAFIDFASFGFTPEAVGQPQIHQNSSGGDVNECFTELDGGISNATGNFRNNPFTGPRWAFGVQSTDNNAALGSAYRFVKVNLELPTRFNVANGSHFHWSESTYQYNTTYAAGNPDVAKIRDFMIAQTGQPSVLGLSNNAGAGYGSFSVTYTAPAAPAVPQPIYTAGTATAGTLGQANHSWGSAGFLASPAVTGVNPPVTGLLSLTIPVNPYSHDTTVAGQNINNCRAPALYNNAANRGVQMNQIK